MAGGNLGEMDVGLQAELFQFGDLFRRQLAVEIGGDDVGVEAFTGSAVGRRRQAAAAGDLLDTGDQLLGGVALGHLLPDPLDLRRLQLVVEVRQ
jgi:hypothetical protein